MATFDTIEKTFDRQHQPRPRPPEPGDHVFKAIEFVSKSPRSQHLREVVFMKLIVVESSEYTPGDTVLWPASGILQDLAFHEALVGETLACTAVRKSTRQGRAFVLARWRYVDRPESAVQTTSPVVSGPEPTELACTCSDEQYEIGLSTGRGFAATCPYHTAWTKNHR